MPFCVEAALESAFAPTLFPRMRGSRLLRHGTALYCRNITVCTVASAHTAGASTQQHYTYRVQRHVNGQILLPCTSPLAVNSGITPANTMTLSRLLFCPCFCIPYAFRGYLFWYAFEFPRKYLEFELIYITHLIFV